MEKYKLCEDQKNFYFSCPLYYNTDWKCGCSLGYRTFHNGKIIKKAIISDKCKLKKVIYEVNEEEIEFIPKDFK